MTAAMLIGLLAMPAPAADEAGDAVARLVSAKTSERSAAAEAIEQLGEAAIPALKEALESRDLELRARAAELMDSIEGRRLLRPTMVTLDFRNARLNAVAEGISQKSGLSIVLEPPNDPTWKTRSVTVQSDEPLPLWEALDRVAKAGNLKLDPPMNPWMRQRQVFFDARGQRRRALTGNEVVFRQNDGSVPPPTSDSGAFRIAITSLRIHRNRSFAHTPETINQPSATSQFTAQILVRAEPKLTLASVDQPRVLEAVDDKGQSLLSAAPPPLVQNMTRGLDEHMLRNTPLVLSLNYPDDPGKSIARLRGSVRALVVGRRPDALLFPLGGSVGKTFAGGSSSVEVHSLRTGPDGRETTIDLTVLTPGPAAGNQPVHNIYDARATLRPPPAARGQIDFLDARGKLCQSFDLGSMGMAYGQTGRTTLTIQPVEGGGPPTEARYYPATWASIEVPYDFRDVPMP